MENGIQIDGWDAFVKHFSKFVDNWAAKKAELLQRMGEILYAEVIPKVPVDTSNLVSEIYIFPEGIPQDYIEVGTNVEYAVYVEEGHVQHRRVLLVKNLSIGGKEKYLKTKGQTGITLSERYVEGAHFMQKALTAAKPRLKRQIESFMEDCAREVEGGRL